MQDTDQREIAETVFDRKKQRGAGINDDLAQEAACHAAAVTNMHRLEGVETRERTASPNTQTDAVSCFGCDTRVRRP
jgi:hypothetical protein